MASLQEYRNERQRKLGALRALGIDPYPAESHRTHMAADITSKFDAMEGRGVTVAGRVASIRSFGKLAFIVMRDASGPLQLFIRDGQITSTPMSGGLSIKEIPLLDSGDFIEASGEVIKTQTGEVSVAVQQLHLLTKSLRPLPAELTNKEERLRRRYVDMSVNPEVRERFIRRSKFWQATRDYLNNHGFAEVNIPVLEHTTGGADANPFVTHMDALGQDFYLRISHELPLKRLLGAGFEKVYDIGPRFRNENYSDEHLPEHVAMEWYWAYADWRAGMKFMTDMYREVVYKTFGTLKFSIKGFDIDLEKDWEEWDYVETIKNRYGIDPLDCTLEEIKKALSEHGLEVEKSENKARGIDKLWKNIRKDVAGPIWLINTPEFISPLSKNDPAKPGTVQRFQPVIAGSEQGNGFSELNDPIDQLSRFLEQQGMREAGDDEAMMLDIDFVEMLEYGMPPACGWGFSERVFWTFEGVTAREGVPFPQLRHEIDEVTKGIYPEVYAGERTMTQQATSRPQDFSKRIVSIVNKELEPWRVANAAAHMNAIIGNEIKKQSLVTGNYFTDKDGERIPRNSQYPIIIKRGVEAELHKLYVDIKKAGLIHHVFIKEMQDTSNDEEIVTELQDKSLAETIFYGVTFFADNELAEKLTKRFQLWE